MDGKEKDGTKRISRKMMNEICLAAGGKIFEKLLEKNFIEVIFIQVTNGRKTLMVWRIRKNHFICEREKTIKIRIGKGSRLS